FQLGTFSVTGGRPFTGLVMNERVIALQALQPQFGATMLDVLDDWPAQFAALCNITGDSAAVLKEQARPLSEVAVHAPIPQPRTIYCSGANYKKHVVDLIVAHQEQAETQGMSQEQKRAWGMKLMEERAANGTPFIFIKPQSTVTGPFDPVIVPKDAK